MDLQKTIEELKMHGLTLPEPFTFSMPEIDINFDKAFSAFVSDYKLQPEYNAVKKYLANNNAKGLILTGANGRGKSIIAKFVIPALLLHFCRKVVKIVDAVQMNDQIDELLTKKFLCIDDIGIEDQAVRFGERRWAFPEIIDQAEKKGNLLIITTNLDADAIEKKYGIRTRERIRACCFPISFTGESLRK